MSLDAEIAVVAVRRIGRGVAALSVYDPKSLDAAPEAVMRGAER